MSNIEKIISNENAGNNQGATVSGHRKTGKKKKKSNGRGATIRNCNNGVAHTVAKLDQTSGQSDNIIVLEDNGRECFGGI